MSEKTYSLITRSGGTWMTGLSLEYAKAFAMDLVKLGTLQSDIEIRRENYDDEDLEQ